MLEVTFTDGAVFHVNPSTKMIMRSSGIGTYVTELSTPVPGGEFWWKSDSALSFYAAKVKRVRTL